MDKVKNTVINNDISGILEVKTNIEIPEIIPPFFEAGGHITPDLVIRAWQFTPDKQGFYREFHFLGQKLRLMIEGPAEQTKLAFSFRHMPLIPPQIMRLFLVLC